MRTGGWLLVVALACSGKSDDGVKADLPGIEVADHAALAERVRAVPVGATPEEASSLLGARAYKTVGDPDNQAHYWRFRVKKAPAGIRYEVWRGQFVEGKLSFGSLVAPGEG